MSLLLLRLLKVHLEQLYYLTLEKDEPELVAQVLKGDIKIGQQKIIDLSQQTTKVKNKIEKFLKEQEKSHRKPPIEPVEHKVTVKDMPKYDPDAEIVSLSFTIPSWIGSIDRVLSKVKFETTSEQARQKLKTIRPASIGQALRISGVNPADISILMVYLRKYYNE